MTQRQPLTTSLTDIKKALNEEQRRQACQMRQRIITALTKTHASAFVVLANELHPLAENPLQELESKTFGQVFDIQQLSAQILEYLNAEQERINAAMAEAVRLRTIATWKIKTFEAQLKSATDAAGQKVAALTNAGFEPEEAIRIYAQSGDELSRTGALIAEIAALNAECADLDNYIRTREDNDAPLSVRPFLKTAE